MLKHLSIEIVGQVPKAAQLQQYGAADPLSRGGEFRHRVTWSQLHCSGFRSRSDGNC